MQVRLYSSRPGVALLRQLISLSRCFTKCATGHRNGALPKVERPLATSVDFDHKPVDSEAFENSFSPSRVASRRAASSRYNAILRLRPLPNLQRKPLARRVIAIRGARNESKRIKSKEIWNLCTRRRKQVQLSAASVLAQWIDIQDSFQRAKYWEHAKKQCAPSSLPSLLLQYLNRSQDSNDLSDDFDTKFDDAVVATLRARGITSKHLAEWAWILSGDGPDEMASRFFSDSSERPIFLLLEILRHDIMKVRNLKKIIIYVWDQVMGRTRPQLAIMADAELDATLPWNEILSTSSDIVSGGTPPQIQETTFTLLLTRLLYQARRLWAPSVVSISHMFASYLRSVLRQNSVDLIKIELPTHHRLGKLQNKVLRQLALPSSIEPFKSMAYNWRAQRVLLELAGRVDPPLIIDQNSYRAVSQVLLASKKSEREARVVNLRTRSWPPWRVDQDGIDAQRFPEEDVSRVLSASIRKRESGYRENYKDKAVNILAGQDTDGTPTIQSRRLVKQRNKVDGTQHPREAEKDLDPQRWTARILAVRDVQEAWNAFNNFRRRGGQPTLSMYHAMFEKLNYEEARLGREKRYEAAPGDGPEVFPVPKDNFSTSYQAQLQPPTLEKLYRQMIEAGILPAGRCLTFLVQHARTVGEGLGYLRDSRISREVLEVLGGCGPEPGPGTVTILRQISSETFTAFISLLCRFTPRVVWPATIDDPALGQPETEAITVPSINFEMTRDRQFTNTAQNPMLLALNLVTQSHTRFRPAWYELFSALAGRGTIVDRSMIGNPRNDIKAWHVMEAAVNDYHQRGLEIDPRGFTIICNGLEKAIHASIRISEQASEPILSGVRLLKAEFEKLSEVNETEYEIPRLLHTISGSQLHSYIRVLGLLGDYEAILSVLKWMVKYHEPLDIIALQSRNGPKLIRNVFTAIGVFCSGTEYEAEAETLVNSVERWDGWPTDYEAQNYLDRWLDTQAPLGIPWYNTRGEYLSPGTGCNNSRIHRK